MATVLIVDDSPTIRRMVRSALRALPVEFAEAASGLEAIEQISLTEVALVVLDLNMPDMHGLEVLAFLRRHPKYARLPVMVVTTRGDDASRTAALAAGASVFVTKPFVPQALADTAMTLIGSSATRQGPAHG